MQALHTEFPLLIRAGDFAVSEEVGKVASWLRAKVVNQVDRLRPPFQGWEYSISNNKWECDPTLKCTRELSPSCTEVIVALEGPAKEKHPMLAGSYLSVKGKTNRGRGVGSYQQHSFVI